MLIILIQTSPHGHLRVSFYDESKSHQVDNQNEPSCQICLIPELQPMLSWIPCQSCLSTLSAWIIIQSYILFLYPVPTICTEYGVMCLQIHLPTILNLFKDENWKVTSFVFVVTISKNYLGSFWVTCAYLNCPSGWRPQQTVSRVRTTWTFARQ